VHDKKQGVNDICHYIVEGLTDQELFSIFVYYVKMMYQKYQFAIMVKLDLLKFLIFLDKNLEYNCIFGLNLLFV